MTRLFMWPHMVQFVQQNSELVGPDLVSRKWRSHMLAHTYVAGNWRSATRVGRSWWRATVACLQFRRELDTQNQSSAGNVVKKKLLSSDSLVLNVLGVLFENVWLCHQFLYREHMGRHHGWLNEFVGTPDVSQGCSTTYRANRMPPARVTR